MFLHLKMPLLQYKASCTTLQRFLALHVVLFFLIILAAIALHIVARETYGYRGVDPMSRFSAWVNKRLPVDETIREHMTEYFAPRNFNILYYAGSLLLLMIVLQLISGFFDVNTVGVVRTYPMQCYDMERDGGENNKEEQNHVQR